MTSLIIFCFTYPINFDLGCDLDTHTHDPTESLPFLFNYKYTPHSF